MPMFGTHIESRTGRDASVVVRVYDTDDNVTHEFRFAARQSALDHAVPSIVDAVNRSGWSNPITPEIVAESIGELVADNISEFTNS